MSERQTILIIEDERAISNFISRALNANEYRTIPIHIQYLKGSYGTVDLGATMALILLSIIPVIVFYLTCQKHIIAGVAAGAVKG